MQWCNLMCSLGLCQMTHATRRRKRRRKGGRRRGSEISRRMKSEKRKNKIGVKAAKGRGKLCTNVCPVADLWMNCAELHDQWSGWLCKVRGGCLDAISAQLGELHRYFWIFFLPVYRQGTTPRAGETARRRARAKGRYEIEIAIGKHCNCIKSKTQMEDN